jgi:nucleotide-binding universal stress UspA family protein
MERRSKSIVISLDGSQNSWRSLDYISLIYGPTHDLDLTLLHILPSLPPVFADDKIIDWQIRQKRMAVSEKNRLLAERILAEAKENLVKKGFDEKRVTTVSQGKGISTAKDICRWANAKQADAILLTKRGSTDFGTFVLGGVSRKLVEYCVNRPVWIVGGNVHSNKVLVCVDSSENALRAVDHTRFMLSGTVCSLTIFHSARHLKHYLPEEVLEGAEELQKLWKDEEGEQIARFVERARSMHMDSGFTEEQIAVKLVDGSRSAADDILREALDGRYGTIVLGRRGQSGLKEFIFGSVTGKILQHHSPDLAIWIVQ